MDDSTRPSAEFPLSQESVTVSRPTDSQMLVLAMSRTPAEGDAESARRLVQKMFRILESCMGSDAYFRVIEDGLIDGTLSHTDVLDLIQRIMQHDWDGDIAEEHAPADLTPEERAMIERMRSGG
jgi:hypothetical protein